MESKLRNLYTLQFIDSNLDELEEMKGDLPAEVRTLDEKVAELTAQRAALEQTMKSAFAQRDHADAQIIAVADPIEHQDLTRFYYNSQAGRLPLKAEIEKHYAEKTPGYKVAD